MNLLDVLIVLAVAGFAISGLRRGLSWVLISMASLVVGIIIAALVATPLAHHFASSRTVEPLIASCIFLGIVMAVQGVGAVYGYRARLRTISSRYAGWDSGLGAGVAAIVALSVTWYLGLVFSNSPWTYMDSEIADSAILRGLDAIAPRPPGFLAQLEQVLRGQSFPNPFAGLGPSTLPPVDIPGPVDTAGTRAAARSTAKVIAYGCGGGAEVGSSWPVSPDYLVTNAHVVAGGDRVEVDSPDGRTHDATVVLFDPDVDVAVLHVPGAGLPPLPVSSGTPGRGTTGAAIGYPGGDRETVVPAAVRGSENARGYNIYGSTLVTREIEVLATHVIPGNSGGPLVDPTGRVLGLVFAASTINPSEGYALSVPQISSDLDAGRGRTQAVSTQDCSS